MYLLKMTPNPSFLQRDLGPKTLAINTAFMILATLAVICRFLARYLKKVGWWYDDWTAFLTLVSIELSEMTSCVDETPTRIDPRLGTLRSGHSL